MRFLRPVYGSLLCSGSFCIYIWFLPTRSIKDRSGCWSVCPLPRCQFHTLQYLALSLRCPIPCFFFFLEFYVVISAYPSNLVIYLQVDKKEKNAPLIHPSPFCFQAPSFPDLFFTSSHIQHTRLNDTVRLSVCLHPIDPSVHSIHPFLTIHPISLLTCVSISHLLRILAIHLFIHL